MKFLTADIRENEIPWKRNYIVTYSLSSNFESYSTLNAEFFIHAIFGNVEKKLSRYSVDGYIAGYYMPVDYEKIASKYKIQNAQNGWQKYIEILENN